MIILYSKSRKFYDLVIFYTPYSLVSVNIIIMLVKNDNVILPLLMKKYYQLLK